MTVLEVYYIERRDSDVKIGYDSWTVFVFSDGSRIMAGCPIPRDNLEIYCHSKRWRVGWKR